MTVFEFNKAFPDEHSCRMHMKAERERQGLCCKKCSSNNLRWIASKYQWHCNTCSFRTTIRSGTIMQFSNLPLRVWYQCMIIMTTTKKPISAHEMQRQLGRSRYEPVWAMMHKIRNAMGQRDSLYSLKGEVELDEGHFGVSSKKKKTLKRGLGSQRKKPVAVMAETAMIEDPKTGEKSSQCRYFKMKALEKSQAAEINEIVEDELEDTTIVLSDKSTRYLDISKLVEGHVTVYSDKETTNTTLKWVHVAISNAKRTLLGIYHCIKWKNLQGYLDEFCYKLNRRYFGSRLFDRLTIAIATSKCKIAD